MLSIFFNFQRFFKAVNITLAIIKKCMKLICCGYFIYCFTFNEKQKEEIEKQSPAILSNQKKRKKSCLDEAIKQHTLKSSALVVRS